MSPEKYCTMLTDNLKTALVHFLSSVPAGRLKRNLEKMFFIFLKAEWDSGLPVFTGDLIIDMESLFELLESIEGAQDESDI